MASEIKVDTISEKTSANGVSIDSVVHKDSAVYPSSADGGALGSASNEWSDLFLADSSVIKFGADQDTTLTHTDGTGLTLNSTNKLCFNDASQFVQGSSATVLSIGATDEIDLTATAVDLNGTLDVSGATTTAAITASGIIKTDDTTEATSTTDGSLQTDGGLSVAKDAIFGDDVSLLSDGAVLNFGADKDVTITHNHNVGLIIKGGAADDGCRISLQTGETTVVANDRIADIDFKAPDEASGTDAVLVAARIRATAEGTFAADNNATSLEFFTASSENATVQMKINSDGLVGIGAVPTPDLGVGLHIKTADTTASVHTNADELVIEGSGSSGLSILSGTSDEGSIYFGDSGDNDIGQLVYNQQVNYMKFVTNASEAMRIQNSGNVSIGTTTDNQRLFVYGSHITDNGLIKIQTSNGSGADNVLFFQDGNDHDCGEIYLDTAANTVGYQTSSDYRLKENNIPISDGIERVKQLKPYRFNWISKPEQTVDGFFAHEVQGIVDEAITGEKDAMKTVKDVVVNADGTVERHNTSEEDWEKGKLDGTFASNSTWEATKEVIKRQGIDQAKLVPLLTSALQGAITKIETLEAKVAVLEG